MLAKFSTNLELDFDFQDENDLFQDSIITGSKRKSEVVIFVID